MFKIHMGGKKLELGDMPEEIQNYIRKKAMSIPKVKRAVTGGQYGSLFFNGKPMTEDVIRELEITASGKPKKASTNKDRVTVKTHDKDVKPGPGKVIKRIKTYTRRKPKKK